MSESPGSAARAQGGSRQHNDGGAGRSPAAFVVEQLRSGRRSAGLGGGWVVSRNAMLLIKGASAATFASTAVAAACAGRGDTRRSAEDTALVTLSRVLGEPTASEAPHASVCAVSSNTRCEDRLAVHSIGAGPQSEHYYAVFDGHGGSECAEFAHTLLSANISACLQDAKGASAEEAIEEAIACGFNAVEATWTNNLKSEWLQQPNYMTYGPPGTERLSSVGACVLLALVHNGTLYVANAGDSRAVLAQKGFGGAVKAQRVTVDLNAMNPSEQVGRSSPCSTRCIARCTASQRLFRNKRAKRSPPPPCPPRRIFVWMCGCMDIQKRNPWMYMQGKHLTTVETHNLCTRQDRLRQEHAGEPDIVRCRGPYSCYVKGCLQPTYSLGDAYLKYAYFNHFPGRVVAPPYKPPYIKTVPQITARPLHNIQEGDVLILGTDGVWDYLSDQNAVDLASRAIRRGASPALAIVEATLELAAARFGITRKQLSDLPLGRQRRLIHDDASVIVVDLFSAVKTCAPSKL